jgi:pyridoxal phosphate enzyme (YggS family)
MSQVRRNVELVRRRIGAAALRAGREPSDITLVAVAKGFPAESVVEAFDAGLRRFGENRVEEARGKMAAVRAAIGGSQPEWHMVGHIQSRKAEDVAELFDYVHSVDRLKVARRLERFAREMGRILPVLLECNVSGEESKYGFEVACWEEEAVQRDAFLSVVAEILEMPGIAVRGLMTMAPLTTDAEDVRPVFARLHALLDLLRERWPAGDWRHLSMGMTDDFEVAVEEGATLVRIGRAVFGDTRP